ncbi:MAG: peptide ABC transporter substrate-binding protein [Dehalococcoidia bacterium]|nr:peptide ABC transporter substrate-binding protein [Dehalococcoidia bacterium]
MRGIRALSAIGLLGLTIFMLACGGSDGGGGQNGDDFAPDGGGGNAAADLRLLGGDPLTLDPAIAGDAGSASYIVELFGGLVTLDRNLQIIPDIAERWDISPDGKVYTFFIRRNAQFHDGKPVTAQDFKFSLDRTAKLGQTASATADAYLGDIVGARDVTRGRTDSITGVEVVDSSTLKITIDAPKPYFLAKLTYPTAFVVDKQQVESNPRNWTRKPNGTGPYKMVEWRLNERIILEANARYHLGAPEVKRVLYNLAGGSSLTQYENNEIDVSGIGINDIERVQSQRDALSQEYVTGPNLSISYIGFNNNTPPFDDPKVRQAFSRAIDREQIARVVLKDMLPIANSIMMPGLPGYNANARTPTFDPEAARQLLAESKYRDARGLGTVTMTEIGGGATVGFDTQAIIEMWRQNLGVEVSISQAESASFFDDLDQGKMQMFSIGWIMDYPDPEDIIDLLFNSTSRQNNTGYSNPQVDALTLEARTEQDTTKRLQLYQQAEQIILEDAPWIPLYFGRDHFVVKPHVKGYDPAPIVIPFLRYLSIER